MSEDIENFLNDDCSVPEDGALQNKLWEEFCRHYADEFWGDPAAAYIAVGYCSKNPVIAKINAMRLLRKPEIFNRISFLRKRRLAELEADRLWIAEQRRAIIKNADKDIVKLHALKDLEKGLGLTQVPKKNEAESVSAVKIVFNGREDGTK